jgi:hypothetical protein
MVTRSQINMTIEEFPSPKEEAEVKVHRPTTNNRRIIVDADESAPRMVTRSQINMTVEEVQVHRPTVDSVPRMVTRSMTQAIDFDGASRAWRKTNPNRHR